MGWPVKLTLSRNGLTCQCKVLSVHLPCYLWLDPALMDNDIDSNTAFTGFIVFKRSRGVNAAYYIAASLTVIV